MPKTTYIIELVVDKEWFKAIDTFTADVQEGEVCDWIRVEAQTEATADDCDNCGDNQKDPDSQYCTECIEEFKETE